MSNTVINSFNHKSHIIMVISNISDMENSIFDKNAGLKNLIFHKNAILYTYMKKIIYYKKRRFFKYTLNFIYTKKQRFLKKRHILKNNNYFYIWCFFGCIKNSVFLKIRIFQIWGISAKMSDSPNSKNSGFWRK